MFIYAHRCSTFLTEQVVDRQADQLRSVSQKYENAKKLWAAAISNLENKIKVKADLLSAMLQQELINTIRAKFY